MLSTAVDAVSRQSHGVVHPCFEGVREVSWVSVLTVALGALGGSGLLAGLTRLAVQLVKEKRLSRVTAKCFEAKNKADREHAIRVLQILLQAGDQDVGIQLPSVPEQRHGSDVPAAMETAAPSARENTP